MKTFVALALILTSSQAMACLPYMPGIKHRILMSAIETVFSEKYFTVEQLNSKSIEELKFAWVNTDSGGGCHDRENAVVKLGYQVTDREGVTSKKEVRVTIQADNGKTTSATVEEITAQ
jgi:hypothetical protein